MASKPLVRGRRSRPLAPPRTLGILLLACLWTAPALADTVQLRFVPQDSNVTGYRAYFAEPGAAFTSALSIPVVSPDASGVASYAVDETQIQAVLGAPPASSLVDVVLTAVNDVGESPFSNRITKTLPTLGSPPPAPPPDDQTGGGSPPPTGDLYSSDFSNDATGSDPLGWLDTGAGRVLDDNLFTVADVAGNAVLASQGRGHSHYVDGTSVDWTDYELRGRMRFDDPEVGVGVTLFSEFPDARAYYRLSRIASNDPLKTSFRVESRQSWCTGISDTEVIPMPGEWYRFRFRGVVEAGGTHLKAKVWTDGTPEPSGWQADCIDDSPWSLQNGPPGLWAHGEGPKYWDDLEVIGLSSGSGGATPAESPEYFMDFELDAPGSDPIDWFDTAAFDSMSQDDSLFSVLTTPGGNQALGTTSTDVNIHSHFLGADPQDLYSYELSGRLMIDDARGGIGVTVYSDYPNSDSYYRLRRSSGNSFHLAPHPDAPTSCLGTTDTGVTPAAGTWYEFRFQAVDDANGGTRLRAKVWAEGAGEPSWQIDCVDSAAGFYDSGVPGVWSMGPGAKYWDDLDLIPLVTP